MAAEDATTRKRSGKRDCYSCLTLESDNRLIIHRR
jgi:hypothetical protein